jgi:hypothetical protein
MAGLEVAPDLTYPAEFVPQFAEKAWIDTRRAARIFGVSLNTVYRMAEPDYRNGRAALALVSCRRGVRKYVLYSSIIAFCDFLRAEYCIEDRRPKLIGPMTRHRDEDLLPFPSTDAIYLAEVMAALGYRDERAILRLVEERRFDGYQLTCGGVWRISRISFERFLNETRDKNFAAPRSCVERLREYDA